MKKTFALTAAACLVSALSFPQISFGAAAHTMPNYFNGFYLGAGAGLNHVTSNNKTTITAKTSDAPGEYTWRLNTDKGNYSGMISIFGGYGRVLNKNFYIGGEAFGRYSPVTLDSKLHETNYDGSTIAILKQKTEMDWSYGVTARGGYLTSYKTLLYVLLGYAWAPLDLQNKIQIPSPSYGNLDSTITKHKTVDGWLAGFGIETYVLPKLSARVQYTYTNYNRVNYKNSQNSNGEQSPQYSVKTTWKDNLKQGIASIDLIYHFS